MSKVRIRRSGRACAMAPDPRYFAVQSGPSAPRSRVCAAAQRPSSRLRAAPRPEEKLHIVRSPSSAQFYESPSPGAPPFSKIGDIVEVGQVLCIVEAMKLMNEIESDVAGEIVKKLVVNGQPIEYGQELFAIRARSEVPAFIPRRVDRAFLFLIQIECLRRY